ncbi:hypothetical protein M501DRAFT_1004522 [Patellaria atrata CBS 101060]|uniref:Uncharacterized protein n=1 Tax=Patellaria atrata CBS 101060 TaxID=1346257 RepID=A0A9P4SBQ8_9PEZI|nr:hypothetical protein M501DRAFT_1004522 [Patellaria atrata CBS 101060]
MTGITIRTSEGIAWIAAFTKWCLGIAPSIYLPNGTALLPQKESTVLITIRDELDFELLVHHRLSNLTGLFEPEIWMSDRYVVKRGHIDTNEWVS